jgi:hypothetical protein
MHVPLKVKLLYYMTKRAASQLIRKDTTWPLNGLLHGTNFSADEEIPRIYLYRKSYYLPQNNLPLVLTLSQTNPVHNLTSYF